MPREVSITRACAVAAGLGVLAGLVLAVAEVVGATLVGESPLWPLRMAASVLIGTAALDRVGPAAVVGVAILDHVGLSAIAGVLYLVCCGPAVERWRGHWRAQVLLGLLFGTGLWLLNVQFVGRIWATWFGTTSPALQWFAHAFFFGLPLAVLYDLFAPREMVRVGGLDPDPLAP